ncbi:MAG: 1-acyl-sn-glycerol-3-phosphate acyltransferase [Gemmataceae bacterium]|nr:1-acyl-sn-glycerol-3-phosphate acyltransferase [Gemmataceae bacterium]
MLWSLGCLLLFLAAIWRAKRRFPHMTWWEFIIIRGSNIYARVMHRWSANRPDPFPAAGPAIVVCTHTCSADPTFLLAVCRRKQLSFIVAHEFYHTHPIITNVLDTMGCVHVRRGGNDPTAARRALRRLEQGGIMCVFPEGGLAGVGRRRMLRGKAGAALLALRSRAPVIPVAIHGGPRTDQLLFSWLVPSPRATRAVFGKPIDLSAYYDRPRNRRTLEEVRDVIEEHVAKLANNKNADPFGARRIQRTLNGSKHGHFS